MCLQSQQYTLTVCCSVSLISRCAIQESVSNPCTQNRKTVDARLNKFTQHHPEWCRIGRCCKGIWGSQTASRLLARLSDTGNVRNQPLSTMSHNGKPTSLLRLVISDVATKSCCPMLCRRQVPLQMDYNWLMISHAHIRVTRQMIS